MLRAATPLRCELSADTIPQVSSDDTDSVVEDAQNALNEARARLAESVRHVAIDARLLVNLRAELERSEFRSCRPAARSSIVEPIECANAK